MARRYTRTLLLGMTLLTLAGRLPRASAGSDKEAAAEVAPFDLSLLAPATGEEQDGVYAARPAALFSRPGAEPARKFVNQQLDAILAGFVTGGLGIHIEDLELLMGRVSFGGENKPGKRSLMLSLNVLRLTREVDWVKLREKCGKSFTTLQWHGETYVRCQLPALQVLHGAQGDGYLWAVDARTLLFDTEDAIKACIDAKASGKKTPLPEYAQGWDKVSRGLLAVALDNRDGRIAKRCITAAERKALLADTAKADGHALRFGELATQIVVGVSGADDCHIDVQARGANADDAAKLSQHLNNLVTALRKEVRDDKTSSDLQRAFLLKMIEHPLVERDGNCVHLHAETASGFNALLESYLDFVPTSTK